MDTKTKIVVVGCGNIGSRHLQALVKLPGDIQIQVIDPSHESKKTARERVNDALASSSRKIPIIIDWLDHIDQIGISADVAIVATTSAGRAEIVNRLLKKGCRYFIIEKIVCQSTQEYENILHSLQKDQAQAWVNFTRRYFSSYVKILDQLKDDAPVVFQAMAGNIGLGCNAIHYLDLFAALTGGDQNLKLNGGSLYPELFLNKRGKEWVEFAGTIVAQGSKSSFASVSFHPFYEGPGAIILITTKNFRAIVDEGQGLARLASRQNNWQFEEFPLGEIYTSQLTNVIVESILNTKTCRLPTIKESYFLHKELFGIFNNHINRITGKDVILCPIT